MSHAQVAHLLASEQFFFDEAGYSYNQKTETREQGRIRCAKSSARAEEYAIEHSWHIDVTKDGDKYGWQKHCFDVVRNPDTFRNKLYTGYDVTLYDSEGNVLGNIGGVTFKGNNPHEPYRRVLFAQLASEAMPIECGAHCGASFESTDARDHHETCSECPAHGK